LQKRIPDLVVVERQANNAQVFFGATVTLESYRGEDGVEDGVEDRFEDGGEEMTVRLVGADEVDPAQKHISVDSPLARAMLKKGVDDEVQLTVDGNQSHYYIVAITYEDCSE
jgi:transcription elongation factor GreB